MYGGVIYMSDSIAKSDLKLQLGVNLLGKKILKIRQSAVEINLTQKSSEKVPCGIGLKWFMQSSVNQYPKFHNLVLLCCLNSFCINDKKSCLLSKIFSYMQ